MDDKIISHIVREMFLKAKSDCASSSKNGLSKYLGDLFDERKERVSKKTLSRVYEKYVEGKEGGMPIEQTVNIFCHYLGYENYVDFASKSNWVPEDDVEPPVKITPEEEGVIVSSPRGFNKLLMISLVCVVLALFFLGRYLNGKGTAHTSGGCMVWKEIAFEKVPCNISSENSIVSVVKLNEDRLRNFRKIEVNAVYPFFDEMGKSQVWYSKLGKRKVEFFSGPGIHPITGKTLKAVTPYIIEKYVPIHDISEKSLESLVK